MNLESEILSIRRTQERIDSKLTALLNKAPKQTWVQPGFISSLTGWDHEKLRQARQQKIVEYRKNKTGGYEYLVESVPVAFIKGMK